MKATNRRILLSPALMVLALLGEVAAAQSLTRFDLPAQPLADSLRAVAATTNSNILFDRSLMSGLSGRPLKAQLTTEAALNQLLSGTGLTFRRLDEKTVTIVSAVTATPGKSAAQSASTKPIAEVSYADGTRLQLAQANAVDVGTARENQEQNSRSDQSLDRAGGRPALEEVVVTAEKRSEYLQDVPVPVTVVSTDRLIESNQIRLQDYYTSVPGLSVAPFSQSAQLLSIRGITTGSGNPTVGITVDDVPYGGSTIAGGGSFVPDIDPADLARIEVLRGPQGTLYGASSMGGLIKFVTIDPSTDGVTGRVQAGTSSVYNSAGLGYNFRASVNVPLSDTVAVRASGFTREDPGYIDNPVLHIDGINEEHVSGGRLAGLWKPSDGFSLKVSALYQDRRSHGSSDVDVEPGLGDLQQNYLRGIGVSESQTQAYSAIAAWKVWGVNLTSISGYNVNSFRDSLDFSSLYGPAAQQIYGVGGVALPENANTNKFTQEVRLSATLAGNLDWLLSGFYTHERSLIDQSLSAEDPGSGMWVGSPLLVANGSGSYTEYAAFANLDYHITDRFDVQVGGRESRITQIADEAAETGVLVGAAPIVTPREAANGNAFTYLVTPRFTVSADLMVYARLASGYRPGGANVSGSGGPTEYAPDKTKNYEVGVKGDVLDHILSFDASLYYIDWNGIQVSVLDSQTGFVYTANAGRAKSQGVELSQTLRPLTGLTITAWVAWDDAVLKSGFPSGSLVYGAPGDRLPNTSRFSGNVAVDQNFPLVGAVMGFVGATVSYVGERQDLFTASPAREEFPAYAKTDLRAGVKYDSWSGNLYVTNLADKRSVLANALTNLPFAFQYIQPRTVGLTISRTF